jgi:hypothetical protein
MGPLIFFLFILQTSLIYLRLYAKQGLVIGWCMDLLVFLKERFLFFIVSLWCWNAPFYFVP